MVQWWCKTVIPPNGSKQDTQSTKWSKNMMVQIRESTKKRYTIWSKNMVVQNLESTKKRYTISQINEKGRV